MTLTVEDLPFCLFIRFIAATASGGGVERVVIASFSASVKAPRPWEDGSDAALQRVKDTAKTLSSITVVPAMVKISRTGRRRALMFVVTMSQC